MVFNVITATDGTETKANENIKNQLEIYNFSDSFHIIGQTMHDATPLARS